MLARNPFNDIASAMASDARVAIAKSRQEDAKRPVGTMALRLGISDYRKAPEQSIDSEDWAVWRVKWNGSEWERNKRLVSGRTFSEALASIGRLCAELQLPRID